MAVGGSLSPGGSYGRIQVVINWVQDNWQHFDSWCCSKNIDPIDLPAYRFYNLALLVIKEGLIDEDPEVTVKQLENLEGVLASCDNIEHPLRMLGLASQKPITVRTNAPKENGDEAPTPESRHKYIPPWYKGEEAAYQTAMAARAGLSAL